MSEIRQQLVARTGKVLVGLAVGAVLLFLLLPPLYVVYSSFFADMFLNFPPREFTFDMYRQLVEEPKWREAVVFSFRVGVPASILAVTLVAPCVLALERRRIPARQLLDFAILAPLLLPATSFAIALYILYLRMGWVGDFWPLVVAEAVVAVPMVYLIIRAAIQKIPARLDFVAMSLGASRVRSMLDIPLRMAAPALGAGAVVTLVNVLDDALYVTFLGGPHTSTVSKTIFDTIQFTLEPVVGALSAAFTLVTSTLVVLGVYLRREGTS